MYSFLAFERTLARKNQERKSKEIREAYKQALANAKQKTIIEVNVKAPGAIIKTKHGEKLTRTKGGKNLFRI